ncbi:MAG TPA: hypothetical protein PKC86_00210 [Candidatus Saccharibacteria bacterium]|nr:hypothetical protein [Candidatus Saccharibacteria bacterium]
MSSPEQLDNNQEAKIESIEASSEQLEKAKDDIEKQAELSERDADAAAERAKTEALESAAKIETDNNKAEKQPKSTSRRGPISKKQKNDSFKRTMKQVQSELPLAKRVFSKVIHNKTVEKVSDVVGSTVARPNAVLSGAVSAFILTLVVYIVAKTIGYRLSGFETIAAFIVGWTIGILYDYLRILITGKKS